MKTQANTVGNSSRAERKDIYVIKNRVNDKVYVGQSIDAAQRFISHCKKQNTKDVSLIDRAIQKYGKDNFWYEILEPQTPDYNELERYWIKKFNSINPNGYNIQTGGEDPPIHKGYDSPNSVFNSAEDVREIKRLLQDTSLSLSEIAKQCGVSKRTVLRINQGTIYEEIDEIYPIRAVPKMNGKLTDEQVEEIIDVLRHTYRQYQDIAAQYGVSLSAVKQINSGDCHPLEGVEYPIRTYKNSGEPACTYDQVTEISDLLMNSTMSCGQIAVKYGIDIQSVYLINNGRNKRYRRGDYTYPLRALKTKAEPVSTISAKESTPTIDTSAERGTPRI